MPTSSSLCVRAILLTQFPFSSCVLGDTCPFRSSRLAFNPHSPWLPLFSSQWVYHTSRQHWLLEAAKRSPPSVNLKCCKEYNHGRSNDSFLTAQQTAEIWGHRLCRQKHCHISRHEWMEGFCWQLDLAPNARARHGPGHFKASWEGVAAPHTDWFTQKTFCIKTCSTNIYLSKSIRKAELYHQISCRSEQSGHAWSGQRFSCCC